MGGFSRRNALTRVMTDAVTYEMNMTIQLNTAEYRAMMDDAYDYYAAGEYAKEQELRDQLNNCIVIFEPSAYDGAVNPERLLEADLLMEPPMEADQFRKAWHWVANGFNRR